MDNFFSKLHLSRPTSERVQSRCASPTAVNRPCRRFWERLSRQTAFNSEEIVSPKEVGSNVSGINCPKRTAISIDIIVDADVQIEKKPSYIHANSVNFVRKKRNPANTVSIPSVSKIAIAGQSPQDFRLTEKFLIQGVESGKGLFQFVSRKNHHGQKASFERSILEQITSHMETQSRVGKRLILGGRYEVMGKELISNDDYHSCHLLTVRDLENDHQAMTVPLTQAGLKFTNRLLRTTELDLANTLMEHHLFQCDKNYPAATSGQSDPMIVSYAGIGRNAALITYREVLSRINDGMSEDELDDALENAITQGRRDRGPKFLHSEEQAEEVRSLLCKTFRDREQAAFTQHIPSPRRPIFGMHVYEPVENQAALPHARDAAVPIDPVPIPQGTDFCAQILSVLESHSEDTPLQLFAALSDEDPHAAAFCAVQARRMLTAHSETRSQSNSYLSMHTGTEVAPNDPKSVNVFSEPAIFLEKDVNTEQRSKKVSIQEVLLEDLRQTTLLSSNFDINSGNVLFPLRFSAALKIGQRDDHQDGLMLLQKLEPEELDAFFEGNSTDTTLELIEKLAVNNPEITSLVNFVDHALLLCSGKSDTQCERYEYVHHADESAFIDKQIDHAQYFFPTFINGVERPIKRSRKANSYWRILDGNEWKAVDNKVEIFRHVISQAREHLQLSLPPAGENIIYPLPVYKLLAKAFGPNSIPQYLLEHEDKIYSTTAANKETKKNQKEKNIRAHAEREQAQELKRAKLKLEVENSFKELGVSNIVQALFANSCFSKNIPNNSIDITIPLISERSNLGLIENICAELVDTHDKQAVSSKDYNNKNKDNLGWLRSSWLSVFSSRSPQNLANRLCCMTSNAEEMKLVSERDAPMLQAIAKLYEDNPVAFIQGILPNVTHDSDEVPTWNTSFKIGAHLGTNLPLKEIFADSHPDVISKLSDTLTIEGFLHDLQIRIATVFRTENPALLDELQRLHGSSAFASSALPISLHRAFDLPIMVIEKSDDDTTAGIEYTNQLRIAVPAESESANWLKPLDMQPEVDMDVISTLSIEFADKPVIWHENNHYEIYLPKRLTENIPEEVIDQVPQQEIQPSLQPQSFRTAISSFFGLG